MLGFDPGARARARCASGSGSCCSRTGIYRHLTVREALAHFAGFYPHPRDVDEVIALVGLGGKEDAMRADAVRRPAAAAGPRARAGRRPRADLPRRADDGLRPGRAAHRVGHDPLAARTSARPSCSPRTTSTRRRRSPTAWRSSRTGGSWPRAPRASSARSAARAYRVAYRDGDGELVERETDDPTTLLHELTGAALARGERLEGLTVTRPTLEDVYLELTAESPSEDAGAERAGAGSDAAVHARDRLSAASLAWRQYRLERQLFWRNPSAAFFNFLLPLIFLALFGAIVSGNQHDLDVIVPGIAGMSVMSTTFTALAYNMTFLREQGVLKRMRGTPLPSDSYLGGDRRQRGHERRGPDRDRRRRRARLFFGIGWPEGLVELVVFVAVGVDLLRRRSASRSRTRSRTSTPRRPTSTPCSCR